MRAPALALLILALGAAAGAQESPAARVADLAWLAGHWRGLLANGAIFEAHYTDAAGGTIVSASKEHRGGRTLAFELELFFEKAGRVFYQPHPNGRRSEHVFPLTHLEPAARRAVFENKEHDFPQTFIFERPADDRLVIILRGPDKNGGSKDIRYELQRVE
ncbi:MAG TPA: DUF6265 family protein [Opitutaceae bacterium]|nr:DUF6265 family protein [Opitutaceae bacterium]